MGESLLFLNAVPLSATSIYSSVSFNKVIYFSYRSLLDNAFISGLIYNLNSTLGNLKIVTYRVEAVSKMKFLLVVSLQNLWT